MILALPESFQITGIMLPLVYLSPIGERGNTEVAVTEHVRAAYTVCDRKIKQNLWEGEFSSSRNSAVLRVRSTLTKGKRTIWKTLAPPPPWKDRLILYGLALWVFFHGLLQARLRSACPQSNLASNQAAPIPNLCSTLSTLKPSESP